MKKIIITLVAIIILTVGGFLTYQKFGNRPVINTDEACYFSYSNDCIMRDLPGIIKDAKGTIRSEWRSKKIQLSELPADSWRIESNSFDTLYNLTVYPNVGRQDYNDAHDFGVQIYMKYDPSINNGISCIRPQAFDDLREEEFNLSGGINVKISHLLNYHFKGEQGSNPNPYTFDIKETVIKIMKSIKIGDCK